MKRLLFSLFGLLWLSGLAAQRDTVIENGAASYVSSQHVYVKFKKTDCIQKGDTLFQEKNGVKIPALTVKDKSSTSCVCIPVSLEKYAVGDAFFARCIVEKTKSKPENKKEKPDRRLVQADTLIKPSPMVVVPGADDKEESSIAYKQQIRGRISAASYSNMFKGEDTHRMRYTLTFQGNHIKNSRFSSETYIAFRHTIGEWQEVRDNFNNALKVYSLNVKYDINQRSNVSLGRKINPRISSMGAIDGLQSEFGVGKVILGGIIGSRPDLTDYSVNLNLTQFGGYISYGKTKNNRRHESNMAFVQQQNHAVTDRRFAYFQHTNDLIRNLNFFGSCEVDFYQRIDSQVNNKPVLTNLLLNLRYRASKRLNLNAGYDNRRNIIYYESYKNFIDQLIDDETRQGLRLGANVKIHKTINLGINSSWRFQKSDLNLSKNLNAYLNISRLPGLNAYLSLSANMLQTNYLNSNFYGARLTKPLLHNKCNLESYYRRVDYQYKSFETNIIHQDIAGFDFSWNLTRKLGLYLTWEGTFEQRKPTFNRVNTRLIRRF